MAFKHNSIALAIFATSASIFAQGHGGPDAAASAAASAVSKSNARSTATTGASTATTGASTATTGASTATASNSGNATNATTVTDSGRVQYSGEFTQRNVSAIALGALASGPCTGLSGGATVAAPGMSIGANAATVDAECNRREAAKLLLAAGRNDLAYTVLDNLDAVKDALAAKAEAARAAALSKEPRPTALGAYQGNDPLVIRRLLGK